MGQCDFAIHMGPRPYYLGRIAYAQLHFFSMLQEVQECMHRYIHPEYYEMLKNYNGAGTFSVLAAALLALLLLLL